MTVGEAALGIMSDAVSWLYYILSVLVNVRGLQLMQ
jgi:hypothetical protein